jgi:hypothetical protein
MRVGKETAIPNIFKQSSTIQRGYTGPESAQGAMLALDYSLALDCGIPALGSFLAASLLRQGESSALLGAECGDFKLPPHPLVSRKEVPKLHTLGRTILLLT